MKVTQFCHFAMRQGKDKEQIPKGHMPILRVGKVDKDQAFLSLEGVWKLSAKGACLLLIHQGSNCSWEELVNKNLSRLVLLFLIDCLNKYFHVLNNWAHHATPIPCQDNHKPSGYITIYKLKISSVKKF